MFFNRVNAAAKLKAEILKDEGRELTNEEKKEIFQRSVLKAAKQQHQRNVHAKNLSLEGHSGLVWAYLWVCSYANKVVQSEIFNNTIFLCILLAGVLVGASTYPGMENEPAVLGLDIVVLTFFCMEVILKVMSEGIAPYQYFIGPEWTWNTFDFLIVLFSLPILPVGGSQVAFLRLIRLMRLAKVFRRVPQLRMIMTGLIGGLKSIVYIVILLLLVFYLYAIAGIFFFRDNDPWHFRTIAVSLTSLFRLATLSNWAGMFYINYYGCNGYTDGLYVMNASDVTSTQEGAPLLCDSPRNQPWLSLAYFVSFIFICSFSMLSLFVGAITVSMSESMETMREEKKQQKKKKRLQEAEKKLSSSMKTSLDENGTGKQEQKRKNMQQRRQWQLVSIAFSDGGHVESALDIEDADDYFLIKLYKRLAIRMRDLTEEMYFQNFITVVIVLAGVQVGMSTDDRLSKSMERELFVADYTIRLIFTIECVFKIIAEELQPWTYFESNWNVFDFIVVVGSYINGGGSLIVMLRLLRLLRVLKLMRMLPQLQVIVTALMSGFSSITFISIILLLFFYFFGIIAMILFSTNDPSHFGNLHITMITLFQCSTLDNWTDILYINLYGCDVFGYDDTPEDCVNPKPQFIVTSLYFVVFVLMGALVLLTLFIGVVATSMEEATEEQKAQAEVDRQAAKVSRENGLKFSTVCLYREVFAALDLNGGNVIDANELRLGLKASGRSDISEKQFSRLWKSVDKDNSGGIDFSEFLMFMIALRDQKNKLLQEEKEEPVRENTTKSKGGTTTRRRPLSAPREALQKVQDSIHASLAALRLQNGFPVLPLSTPKSTEIGDMVRFFDNETEMKSFRKKPIPDNSTVPFDDSSPTQDIQMDTMDDKPLLENELIDFTDGHNVASEKQHNIATAQERVSNVPGKKSRKGENSPRRGSREPSVTTPIHSSLPEFPPITTGDGHIHHDNYGRSYEDRKRSYLPSDELARVDSRSFILETPYKTSRLSPQGQISNSLTQGSKHKKTVVSKACFI